MQQRKVSESSTGVEDLQSENIVCTLCLYFEAEKPGDCFVVAKCGHLYHLSCITLYLNRGRFICPTCNRPMHTKKLTKLYGVDPNPNPSPNTLRDPSFSNSSSYDYSFKLVLLGSSGAGKSCLLKRFYDNSFDTRISYTGGTDLVRKTVHMGDEMIQLIIWDTIGQDKFKAVISTCVRDAQGVILVYDVGSRQSFEGIQFWLDFAKSYAPKDTVKMLVGNKIDLESERVVTVAEGEALARYLDVPFFETSAKEDCNVEQVFRTLTGKILENEWIMSALNEKMRRESTLKLHRSKFDPEECEASDHGCFTWLRRGWTETAASLQRAWNSLLSI